VSAAAERLLSDRHRTWPPNLYAWDRDDLRADGRLLLVETPAGIPAVQAEYKSIQDGPLDLDGAQYRGLAGAAHPHVPFVVVQFTCPLDHLPWCFRLHPACRAAADLLGGTAWTLTERHYVHALYVVKHGVTAPGATPGATTGVVGLPADPTQLRLNTYEKPCRACRRAVPARRGNLLRHADTGRWLVYHHGCLPYRTEIGPATFADDDHFARLDDEAVDIDWPPVTLPRYGWAEHPPAPHTHAVHEFLRLYGQPSPGAVPAPLRLAHTATAIAERPALGALAAPALAAVPPYEHDLLVEEMWAGELASDDNRDMWR
jgi:hypothetical protein